MAARNRIAELLEIKGRAQKDYNWHLEKLKKLHSGALQLIGDTGSKNLDFLKYLPVAMVACFEAYFKTRIAEIIDEDEKFVERILKGNDKTNSKFDISTISALKRKSLSIGEVISHSLSFNSLEDLNNHLSKLIGDDKDFFKQLKEYWPSKTSTSDKGLNFDKIKESIFDAYRTRHIICHEFADLPGFKKDTYINYLSDGIIFLNIASLFLDEFFFTSRQLDFNADHTKRLFQEADTKLTQLLTKVDAILRAPRSAITITSLQNTDDFNESIEIWKKYRLKRGEAISHSKLDLKSDPFGWKIMEELTIQMILSIQEEFKYELEKFDFEFFQF